MNSLIGGRHEVNPPVTGTAAGMTIHRADEVIHSMQRQLSDEDGTVTLESKATTEIKRRHSKSNKSHDILNLINHCWNF